MRPPLGAPMGLLWDPQVTHGKPIGYANESQGVPQGGQPVPKVKYFANTTFWQGNFGRK